ncbi:MAG: DUF2244 domain-containing protein [Pikeienuella sp.]
MAKPKLENNDTARDHSLAVSHSGTEKGDPFTRTDPPAWSVVLWPNRSLSPKGFRWLMGIMATGFAMPILALAGTAAMWVIAGAAAIAMLLLWGFIKYSYFTGQLTEEIKLWPDLITVERKEPSGQIRRWSANPYWVDITKEDTREIESYLTLRGGNRRIELGVFLTPEERVELAGELRSQIRKLNP